MPELETPPVVAPGMSGIDAMMQQLDEAHASGVDLQPPSENAPPSKPATTAAPVTKPAEAVKPATVPKIGEKPAEAAKPADPAKPVEATKPADDVDWSKAPPKWYKIYEGHKAKTGETIKTLEAKIKQLETKPFESAGDAAKIAAYEKQLEEFKGKTTNYEKQLAELDYRRSDDYKQNFVAKANRVYNEAVNLMAELHVNQVDGDGNETRRQATAQDFDYIRSLPIGKRREAARTMFPDASDEVLGAVKQLDYIRQDADAEVAKRTETYHQQASQKAQQEAEQAMQHKTHHSAALEEIRNNPDYGHWFKENADDAEASKIIKDGFEEVARFNADKGSLPPAERARYEAVFEARAAAMPRVVHAYNTLKAEKEALLEELEKFRSTDPGSKPKGGTPPGTGEKRMGIEEAARAFDDVLG